VVVNTFHDLLTVTGVLAGIGALLFLMSALDPTNAARPTPAHRGTRDRSTLDAGPAMGDTSTPSA
jgi:hypothetical protein